MPFFKPDYVSNLRIKVKAKVTDLLDAINTKEDCEKFVSYCYYPPIGQRSFGPMRAQLIHGSDYFEKANENILSFAMIETQQAIDNIDEFLKTGNCTNKVN